MITLPLKMDADLAISVLERARDEGMELEAFVTSVLRRALNESQAIQPESVPSHWLDEAVQRAKRVGETEEFKLQDLFTKSEWKAIPSPTVFGKAFRKICEQQGFASHIGKTAANQAIYKRL